MILYGVPLLGEPAPIYRGAWGGFKIGKHKLIIQK
jgi:hypothetical protein